MQYFLNVNRLYPVVKIQVGNIGANKDQVAFLKIGNTVPHMSGGAGAFNIDQLVLWMKMPIEQMVQTREVQKSEWTFGIGRYGL